MTKDEIAELLRDSISAVLREKQGKGRLLVPTGTLDALVDELANNAAAPLVLLLDVEAQSEYHDVVRALDVAGIPNTRDGIMDAYTIPERIQVLAMQRNAAEERATRLRAALDTLKPTEEH